MISRLSILVLALFLSACDTTPPAPAPSDVRLAAVVPVRQLTPPQATTLEFDLLTSPNDIQSRVDLLWHYRSQFGDARAQREADKHVLWLIEHQPRAAVLATPIAEIPALPDPTTLREAAALWERQIEAHPKDAKILGHAGVFFASTDPAKGAALLQKAAALDADSPVWPAQLARAYHALAKASPSDPEHRHAKLAMQAYRKATDKARTQREKADLLQRLSVVAIEANDLLAAQKAADELRTLAAAMEEPAAKAVALHAVHVARGRAELLQNRPEHAAEQLRGAAQAIEGQQVSLIELDMSLARDLLAKGHAQPVMEYFDAVVRATKSSVVSQWIPAVKESKVPDFEGYLH